jgi:hypothetical protein
MLDVTASRGIGLRRRLVAGLLLLWLMSAVNHVGFGMEEK